MREIAATRTSKPCQGQNKGCHGRGAVLCLLPLEVSILLLHPLNSDLLSRYRILLLLLLLAYSVTLLCVFRNASAYPVKGGLGKKASSCSIIVLSCSACEVFTQVAFLPHCRECQHACARLQESGHRWVWHD